MSLYSETLRSDRWQQLKWQRIMRAEFSCESCGRRYQGRTVRGAVRWFQLHHRHYRSVGREDIEDVLILCRVCHLLEHGLIEEAAAS